MVMGLAPHDIGARACACGHMVAFHPRDQTIFILAYSETMSTVLVEYVLAEYSREGRELDYICYLVPIRMYRDKLYSLRDFPTVLS